MIQRVFNIDLQDKTVIPSHVVINQGNVDTVTFSFKIYDGVNEIDYSQFDTARITLSRGNKTILNSPCELEEDSVTYKVEPEALGYTGTIKGQLDLSRDGVNLATTYFAFEVIGSLTGLSEADKKVFIGDIQDLIDKINASAQVAESTQDLIAEAYELLEKLRLDTLFDVGVVTVEALESGAPADVDVGIRGNTIDFTFKLPKPYESTTPSVMSGTPHTVYHDRRKKQGRRAGYQAVQTLGHNYNGHHHDSSRDCHWLFHESHVTLGRSYKQMGAISIEIGVVIALIGGAVGLFTYLNSRHSMAKSEGKWQGGLDTKLDHIQDDLKDIKDSHSKDLENLRATIEQNAVNTEKAIDRTYERMDERFNDHLYREHNMPKQATP